MNKYEILYIIESGLDDAAKEAQIEKFSNLVTGSGGEVESVNKWGTKKFAYPINYKKDGYYVLMNFTAGAELPAEMERQMRISDEIMRFMTVKKN